jgi:predicted dithiol-disulfide oxidoreductase (DUF899 family)
MALPEIVSPAEWLTARRELLAREKELTRQRDALSADRRRLPTVQIEKEYVFGGPDGPVTLAGLFAGCSQLIVQDIMPGPGWEAGCPSRPQQISQLTEAFLSRLKERDTAFALTCRAPLARIEAHRAGRGWVLPWYSTYGTDFNYDFTVTVEPCVSCFVRDGEGIFLSYSACAQDLDRLQWIYAYLDLTVFGRQRARQEPEESAPVLQRQA